ncbi:XRE family transcriptional regulator [archaeon]|nr:MAG: XRE family transcriptional regulator [archaeon]
MEERYQIEIQAFGRRIRELRKSKELSQLDLEISSGIARTEISRIERGQRNVEFMTIVRLAAGLDLPVVEMFKV